MYQLTDMQPVKLEEITFAELGMKESDIEELLRKNIDMICSDEESLLVVGQQVKNAKNGRSDLTAVDNEGNLVLVEIKRDKKDIEARSEAFEFQAIRYAASCATIKSTDELIQSVFSPYVQKHAEEFVKPDLSSSEIASRVLMDFFEKNKIVNFNETQRIILVASEFDEQTLSAVAWLNSNKVDISCYRIYPYKISENVFVDVKKILPVMEYDDFYVDISSPKSVSKDKKREITRRVLPKIDAMLEWGVVKAGDIVVAKDTDEEAILTKEGTVQTKEGVMSLQQWLKGVYGWSSVHTYGFAIKKENGKTLDDIREEYMLSDAYDMK
ncbi:MAG: hypothetical protein E7299_05375 [Lachnospiraceae bacterium]|nr:hypothetical protein [Lachnospiraceae bacterium]